MLQVYYIYLFIYLFIYFIAYIIIYLSTYLSTAGCYPVAPARRGRQPLNKRHPQTKARGAEDKKPKSETRRPKPEKRNPKPDTRSPTPETDSNPTSEKALLIQAQDIIQHIYSIIYLEKTTCLSLLPHVFCFKLANMPVTTVSLDSEVAQASVWLDHRLLTISKAIKELLLLARLASLPQKSKGFGGTALSGSATTIQEPGVITLSSTIEKYNIILRQSRAKGNTQKNKEIPTIIQQISLWESRPVRLLQKRRCLNKNQRFCSPCFKLNFSFSCFYVMKVRYHHYSTLFFCQVYVFSLSLSLSLFDW